MELMEGKDQEEFFDSTRGVGRIAATRRPRVLIAFGIAYALAGAVGGVFAAIEYSERESLGSGLSLGILIGLVGGAFGLAFISAGRWSLRNADEAQRVIDMRNTAESRSLRRRPAFAYWSIVPPITGLMIAAYADIFEKLSPMGFVLAALVGLAVGFTGATVRLMIAQRRRVAS